jgi:hypothetical protein
VVPLGVIERDQLSPVLAPRHEVTPGPVKKPFYGWFTASLNTLDLKQAKALLDEL